MQKQPHPQCFAHRLASVLAVSAMAMGLSACDKMKEPTIGQKIDSALERTDRAAAEAKVNAESAVSSAQQKMQEGVASTEAAASNAAQAARDVGSSAMGAGGDAALTAQVSAGLAQDSALSAIKIDVDTSNGVVTLTGPAPSQEAKERATTIAQGVKGVSSVVNHLTVNPG